MFLWHAIQFVHLLHQLNLCHCIYFREDSEVSCEAPFSLLPNEMQHVDYERLSLETNDEWKDLSKTKCSPKSLLWLRLSHPSLGSFWWLGETSILIQNLLSDFLWNISGWVRTTYLSITSALSCSLNRFDKVLLKSSSIVGKSLDYII